MTIHITEQAVTTPGGNLFVRMWAPAGTALGNRASPPCPFVLLHDSLGSVDLWRDFPEALAQATGKPVVAYDRLGYGQSDPAQGLPPANFVAQEGQAGLKPVLDQLQLQRAILLGHSVGGGMAVNAAVQMPERIAGVVTVAAQAFPEDRTLQAIAQAKLQFQDEAQLAAWTESWLSPAFASWHVCDVLPQLKCPLLALHGEHDEYGTAVHPQMYSERAGGPSRMMLIPGAHHLPHREQPQAVAQWVQDFVQEHGL
jgi:pimeloyl-ACP methyl ester carboxylesterase